jgi:hypothetical protein
MLYTCVETFDVMETFDTMETKFYSQTKHPCTCPRSFAVAPGQQRLSVSDAHRFFICRSVFRGETIRSDVGVCCSLQRQQATVLSVLDCWRSWTMDRRGGRTITRHNHTGGVESTAGICIFARYPCVVSSTTGLQATDLLAVCMAGYL